jgi:anti-sigma B factor antagonist
MNLRVDEVPGARALRLEGELDMMTIELLQCRLDDASVEGGPLVVDLRELTFMDSTGIHAWVRASQLLAAHDWCVYLHVRGGIVERVLKVAGLDGVPNVHVVRHPLRSA